MLKSAAEAPFTLHTLFQGHPQKNKFVSAKLSYGDMLGTIMLRTVDCFLLSSAFTGCFVGETMRTLQPSDRGHKQCQCLDKQHPKKKKKKVFPLSEVETSKHYNSPNNRQNYNFILIAFRDSNKNQWHAFLQVPCSKIF